MPCCYAQVTCGMLVTTQQQQFHEPSHTHQPVPPGRRAAGGGCSQGLDQPHCSACSAVVLVVLVVLVWLVVLVVLVGHFSACSACRACRACLACCACSACSSL
jgi:hypothetical protein